MSVIVVGLEQRQSPLDLLERVAVPETRPAQGARPAAGPVQPVRGGHPLHLPAHRGLRRGRAVPRRRGRDPGVPGHHQRQPGRLADRAPHRPVRRRCDQPPLRGGRRARLRRARRVRGPGPGAAGLGEGPERAGVGAGARRPLPPRRRDRQAGPVGDGHRPGHHLAVARGGGPGRRTAGAGSGRCPGPGGGGRGDGRGGDPGPGRGRDRRAGRGQPHRRSDRGGGRRPARRGRRPGDGGRRSTTCPACWPPPTWSSPRWAPPTRSSTGPCSKPPCPAAAPATTLLVVDLGVPRNVEPSAAALDGLVLLDMEVLRAAVADALSGRAGGGGRCHPHRHRRGRAVPGGLPGPRRRTDGVGPPDQRGGGPPGGVRPAAVRSGPTCRRPSGSRSTR